MSDESLRVLEREARGSPSFGSWYKYGLVLVRAGRRFEARVAFWHALEFDVRSAEAQAIFVWFPDLSYKALDWEVVAPHQGNEKQLFTYDHSLEGLRRRGFVRHARPVEVFGLLADGLRSLFPARSTWCAVYDDLLKSFGEWMSVAFERKGDELIVYVDPQGLVWNAATNQYVQENFSCAELKTFMLSVKEFPSQQLIDLSLFSDGFVRFLYGCSFAELPQEMREGDRYAQVGLPPEGIVWPVGRHGFDYDVDGFICISRASRGVVAAQKFS